MRRIIVLLFSHRLEPVQLLCNNGRTEYGRWTDPLVKRLSKSLFCSPSSFALIYCVRLCVYVRICTHTSAVTDAWGMDKGPWGCVWCTPCIRGLSVKEGIVYKTQARTSATWVRAYVCVRAYIYICIRIFMHVCVYICMYVHIYIYAYIHTRTHTRTRMHTHTQTQ